MAKKKSQSDVLAQLSADDARAGGRIESTLQSRAAPPLSWGACLAAFIVL